VKARLLSCSGAYASSRYCRSAQCGKSTLFNAVTRTKKAQAENYPFCTIDPNQGIVTVPDERLDQLAAMSKSVKTVPAAIEFVDIAGLVKGASQGEGLGNQFLSHVREVDAIIQVVRCFEDEDVHHVDGSVDPVRDIEVINTELILADAASVAKRKERAIKTARGGDKQAKEEVALAEKLIPHLDSGKPALTLDCTDEERATMKQFFLLTSKPTIFACNVEEGALAEADSNELVQKVRAYAAESHSAQAIPISARIEAELAELDPAEADEYLKELGVTESGLGKLIRAAYELLGLRTYFTTGEKESRAWTIHAGDKAPQAAGVIHTDFERGFIAAETIGWKELLELGSFGKAREAGKLRVEGKEYTVAEGDVMEFRFNV